MTKKEEMPKKNEDQDQKSSKDLPFNPEITSEDKEVLNNQSKDEKKGEYFQDRDEPIDYAGADLDVPELDDKQFNPTRNKPDDSERKKRPKESANSNDNMEEQSDTIYKGDKAEKYKGRSKGSE
ncbi:hypothetical protein [Salinimicrobium gaetbulicola]|uniref:Uncharacterized protein n=1 Tax=Salinimicrobium gaetbulicola TaxID=999702 RepID=A0ABW3IDR2_9FLAO